MSCEEEVKRGSKYMEFYKLKNILIKRRTKYRDSTVVVN